MQNITVSINYTPESLADLMQILDRVEGMKSATVAISPALASLSAESESGPHEADYKRRTGTKRFRMTDAERESGMTREQAAKSRLDRLEAGESIQDAEGEADPTIFLPAPEEALPEDTDLF